MTIKKYNLAFIPKYRINTFISLVSEEGPDTNGYCISHHSIPHITICHFFFDSLLIENVWREILNQIDQTSLRISFSSYSTITFDKNTYWLSLMPNEYEYLKELFKIVSNLIDPIRKDLYDPHLTLFNYAEKDSETTRKMMHKNIFIEDEFNLVLGDCDEIGQLSKYFFP